MVLSTFAEQFYTGIAPLSGDVPARYHVAINGIGYMVDWSRYARRILPPNLEQRDRSERELGEIAALNTEDGFRVRSRSSWDLGAGQRYVDRPASIEGMFWRSQGVDVFTENQACMLADTELAEADTATFQRCMTIGAYFYFITDTAVYHTTDPHASTISWTDVSGITGTILDATTDGNRLFLARDGAAMMSHTIGDAGAAAFGSLQPTGVAYANGRLIGWNGGEIYEIDNTGAKVGTANIWTHPRTGATWKYVISTPIGIFAALDLAVSSVDSGRVQFFFITSDDATGALSPPTFAGELPVGENIYAMERYNRVIAIGTSKGWRVAEYGNNNLQVGTLDVGRGMKIRDNYGDVDDGNEVPVRCFEGVGENLWFGWSGFSPTQSGLGRADLSRTTIADEIVPPIASDLMAAAGVTGDVLDIATFAGKRLFCVSGSGLWREVDNRVESGWIDTGLISFGATYTKVLSSLRYGTADDGASSAPGTIAMQVTAEDGSTRTLGPYPTTGALGSLDVDLTGRDVQLRITLGRSATSPTLGPCLRFWSAEAFAVTTVGYEILVPIIVSEKVVDNHGNGHPQNPLEILNRLDRLARSTRQAVTYQELGATYRCRIHSVEVAPGDVISPPNARNYNYGWLNSTINVRLTTRPTTNV